MAVALCVVRASPATASLLILNRGFETGFASWTIADQVGSDGTFHIQSGITSPLNGDAVPAPPGGTFAAMTDAFGPGSHVFDQDFVVGAPSATLSFDLLIGNRFDASFTANPATVGLDFSAPALNQQARVDILKSNADPFSVAASDVLLNLVLEKASGQVKRVIGGVVQASPVLDLAVNSNSERGLLSTALDPDFPANPSVYVRWTESSTGADSTAVLDVRPMGNRVDRFIWNGVSLTYAENLIRLRSLQTGNIAVSGHPGTNIANPQGNHKGGVLTFGPDGKLYLFMGDQGRRGWLQNLPNGPFLTAPFDDDTCGGPTPDNAHLADVILRLNTDGTARSDNPFLAAGAAFGGEVGANFQKVFSYGHRNGFGMAFDPAARSLWVTENAEDAYSELNRVVPGMNGGWIQLAGPLSRVSSWKTIETTLFGRALQQVRYPPTRAACTGALAVSRMLMLPGAIYVDPELSWKYEIGPSGTAFAAGDPLGADYDGALWMGSSRSFAQIGANGGSLCRTKLTADRMHIDTSADPRLADRVANNLFRAQKFEGTESEMLQIGTGFGTTPDIEQGPDGNLYVVSMTDNEMYMVSRR